MGFRVDQSHDRHALIFKIFFIIKIHYYVGVERLELSILTEYGSEPYAYTSSATRPNTVEKFNSTMLV